MILRETNDSGDEVSIVIEQVVAWKRAHNRITVFVGYHTFAFFGEAVNRIESRLRSFLGDVVGAPGAPAASPTVASAGPGDGAGAPNPPGTPARTGRIAA